MARIFQSKEELAHYLASDTGFLELPKADRDAIYQKGLTRIQLQAEPGQGAETIGAPLPATLQDVLPASARLQQASATHPVLANLPFLRAGAMGADLLKNVGAAVGTPLETLRRAGEGGGVHPAQSYLTELRGGRIEPTLEQERMKQLTNVGVGMLPVGSMVSPMVNRVRQALESLPLRVTSLTRRLPTVAEVLATPEVRLPKLSQDQQRQWFSARKFQIKQQFAMQQAQLKLEREGLQRELAQASTARTLELRPQVPAYLSRQSSHYRQLADAELAPLANEPVAMKELAHYVNARWGKDAEALTEVSARLGLGNESLEKLVTSPLLDDLGRPIQQTVPETMKLGQVYQQAKELGQQLPSSVRESLRVYTRDEHFIDDAIDTLQGFLRSKGINLSEANTFWRTWAPVRNQLVSETKPYNLAGTRTVDFANRLSKLARGIDPNNINYAETIVKGLFGEKATIETLVGPLKSLVSKLDTNMKSMIASKLQEPIVQEELKQLRFTLQQQLRQGDGKWHAGQTALRWMARFFTGRMPY